jgi:peptidyl-dipeptidase Dcp
LPLTSEADLAGLPDFLRQSARGAAKERGVEGYVITLSRSLVQPFLTWSTRRDLRETAWRAWTSRGENPARDNRPIAREILMLRQEQARLLGYENFADYALADRMAGKASAVHALLSQVWEPAKASVAQERQALAAQAAALGEPADIEPWDWYYLAEKVRVTRYALDDAQVKPYFSLDAMLAAMFDCAERLFGVQFIEKTREQTGVPCITRTCACGRCAAETNWWDSSLATTMPGPINRAARGCMFIAGKGVMAAR